MSIQTILTQMTIMILFLVIGCLIKKKGFIGHETLKELSWLLVTVIGPCQTVSTVVTIDRTNGKSAALIVLGITAVLYCVLFILGGFIGRLIRAPRSEWAFYDVMTVFGNVGFLGIPLARAMLGDLGGFYLAIANLNYNLAIIK